jgi:hypothetical protein
MVFFKKKVIHFLHIGKTGGTTLTKMLDTHKFRKFKIKIHSHDFKFTDVTGDELIIFFLRNPIDRFVSGFYSRKRMGKPVYNVPWNKDEIKAFEAFETPNELAEMLCSDEDSLKKKAEDAMKGIRHVNTHFKDWLIDEEYLIKHKNQIFYIGYQETFNSDVKKLYKKLTKNTYSKDIAKEHQARGKSDKFLSEKAIRNLKEWYEHDFKLFQFCQTLSKKIN